MRAIGGLQFHSDGTAGKERGTTVPVLRKEVFAENNLDAWRADNQYPAVLPLQELRASQCAAFELFTRTRQEESQAVHDRLLYDQKVPGSQDARAFALQELRLQSRQYSVFGAGFQCWR